MSWTNKNQPFVWSHQATMVVLCHHNRSFSPHLNQRVRLCVCVCHLRPLLTSRPWGLQLPSCWRTPRASPAEAPRRLTPLALTLLLTPSLSVTILTCRCVSLIAPSSPHRPHLSVSRLMSPLKVCHIWDETYECEASSAFWCIFLHQCICLWKQAFVFAEILTSVSLYSVCVTLLSSFDLSAGRSWYQRQWEFNRGK